MTRLGSPETVALAQKFGILGVPTVIFLDASGQERTDLRLVGFEDAGRVPRSGFERTPVASRSRRE